MWKNLAFPSLLLAMVAVFAVQQHRLNSLNKRLDALQRDDLLPRTLTAGVDQDSLRRVVIQQNADSGLSERLAALENAVNELAQTADFLMEKGQVPLAAHKVEEMLQRLGNPSASSRDRLQALRLLRNGDTLNESAVTAALNWLSTTTNGGLRENILQQMEGVTNRSLQAPLLQLASSDADPEVREQAVDNLRRYMNDPQVEAKLWDLLNTEKNEEVRQEIAGALMRGPQDQTRYGLLEQRALNTQASLDERLIALQVLRRAGAQSPNAIAALAQEAYTITDSAQRVKLFNAFDNFNDPVLKTPLVYGLQDPSPEVRARAADALSNFRTDPAVLQWLQHIAQNDENPRVRQEALRAIGDRRL